MDFDNKCVEVCPHCGKETAVDATRLAKTGWTLCLSCGRRIFYRHYPCGGQIQFSPRHVSAEYFGYCPCCDEDVYRAECKVARA